MKNLAKYCLFAVVSAVMLVSCEVDFNPNEQWTEYMMVYGTLDQDDDTTFVRIEKGFLGDGNTLEYAKTKDSIYYKQDELDVKLCAYNINDTNNAVESLQFQYTVRPKQDGTFYSSQDCPVYYCVTKNKLKLDKYYKLEITNKATGKKVTAGTYLIADYSIHTSKFSFSEMKSSAYKLPVKWKSCDNDNAQSFNIGKQYQVDIRFYYKQSGAIKYIDIPMNKVVNTYSNATQMSTDILRESIVNAIDLKLRGQTDLEWYQTKTFEIRILACNLAMYDYMSINDVQSQNILNYKPLYSNINGGLGVFASIRKNIAKGFPLTQVDGNLQGEIKKLNIGF